ncbi:hypothetical protein A4D02_21290 [Niastella koreensis]|uniref:Uncharacterized protein n=1 Tax=Niastella koreensis TaxID=354356 RepID=A0ABX3P341_9BACT|nr:hypothetical protein A4D02_21290 [Niastella koreensis]
MTDAKMHKVVWHGWRAEQLNYSTIMDKGTAKSVSIYSGNLLRPIIINFFIAKLFYYVRPK